jgi:hypothetical protein
MEQAIPYISLVLFIAGAVFVFGAMLFGTVS